MSILLRSVLSRNVFLTNMQLTQIYRNFNTKSTLLNGTFRSPIKKILPKFLSSAAHDHSKLWILEKAVSVGLLAVIPASLACQNTFLDYALALSLVAHIHWGFEAMVVDYIRPSLFGSVIPKAAIGGLYFLSIIALAGLFYLNYTDVGLSTAVNMIVNA